MKKETILVLVGVVLACATAGFVVGRRFPAHHYEHLTGPDIRADRYLFIDTGTGKICDAMEPFGEQAVPTARKDKSSFDDLFAKNTEITPEQDKPFSGALAEQDKKPYSDLLTKKATTTPTQSNLIPACGKE